MTEALQSAPSKRRRADVYRERVQVRLSDGLGLEIAAVLKDNGVEFPAVDWSEISGHWLVAVDREEVVGCIMVVPAKPIGLLEFLFVKPGAHPKVKAIALQKLAMQGAATLIQYGSSFMSCTVDLRNKPFYNVLTKYGFMPAINTCVMVKRLGALPVKYEGVH